jgi:hypothetical protein
MILDISGELDFTLEERSRKVAQEIFALEIDGNCDPAPESGAQLLQLLTGDRRKTKRTKELFRIGDFIVSEWDAFVALFAPTAADVALAEDYDT